MAQRQRRDDPMNVAHVARVLMASPLFRNLVVAALVLGAAAYGLFQPLDRVVQEKRFQALTHHPTGQVALVEIDSASLRAIGVWPWPRALHAHLVDNLVAMGARKVVFDVDFSAGSSPVNDEAFAAALKRANGRVALGAFQQSGGAGEGWTINKPIKLLADQSKLVSIDVPIDPDGYVRDYWPDLPVGDARLDTVGTYLSGAIRNPGRSFGLDYGVDLDALDRMSASDVMAGSIDPKRIEGKEIIIGASAEELRDFFMTPRYGMIPGCSLHALAAETLLQGLDMRDAPFALVAALVLLLALIASALGYRVSRPAGVGAALLASVAVEAGAQLLQHGQALRLATSPAHFALAGFVVVGVLADLRLRRKLHTQASRERDIVRAMLGRVVADNFDGVVVVDAQGKIIAASRPARELLGQDLEGRLAVAVLPRTLGKPLDDALAAGLRGSGPAATPGETRTIDAAGDPRFLEFVITVSAVDGVRARSVACLTFRDITERRAHEARLDYLARHDELTGAWTRGQLADKMAERLVDSGTTSKGLTLFSLDLRRFVLVNDVFGHHVGDAVLNAVVGRLRASGYAMVSRLGGDSFAFAGPGEPDGPALDAIGQSLIARICEPYLIDSHKIIIGATLGATTTALSGRDPSALLTHASMAQASAKKRMGDVFRVFSPDMETLRREKQVIDAELRHAIADGSLALHYQAKVDLKSGRFIGAEALMRWRTPDGSPVPPAKFIPIAEESGLIAELGRWALHRACAEARNWPAATIVAVNVSPVQFALSDVFEEVRLALEASGLPPNRLEIEITESIFVERESAISVTLEKLRALGVSVALDDFGTGYSSLHYLGRLPIDTIKIDQSFIRRLLLDPQAAATVQAIVTLARAHGKKLVAEGVEDIEQARFLLALGCEYGQGYYYGRPEDAARFRAALEGEPARADGLAA